MIECWLLVFGVLLFGCFCWVFSLLFVFSFDLIVVFDCLLI